MQKNDYNNNDLNQQNQKRTRKTKLGQKNVGSKSTKNTRRTRPIDSSQQNLLPAQIPKTNGFQIIDFHSYQKQLTKLILQIPITLIDQSQFKKAISARIQQIQVDIAIEKDKEENLICMIKLKEIKQAKQSKKSAQGQSDEPQQPITVIFIWGKCVYLSGFEVQNKTIKKSRKQVNSVEYNQISKVKIKDANSDMFICLDLRSQQFFTDEYNGLINQGNTCYMNSYLQMLFHIPIFRNLVYQAQIKDQMKFPATLQDLFYKLTNSDKAVSPQSLVKSFGWGKKEAHIQQDAQQFSCLFFEALQKKLLNSAPQNGYKNMTIQDLFKGQLTHYIRCTDVSIFIDLQIPVSASLKDSIQEYTSQVHLQGQNKYHTQDFGLQQAFKGVLVSLFPPVLMIQLKRFQYSFQLERNIKILDKFVYPEFFNFGKWSQTGQSQQYQLYGVLVHEGSKAESGHYYNYLKINNSWYKFNDELVQQVPHQKVFNYNFGGPVQTIQFDSHQMKINPVKSQCKSTAYMLVYVKKQYKTAIFDVKSQYPQWLIQKDANRFYAQQQRKNRKYYFHDINVINWNNLKCKQCPTFGFLTEDLIFQTKQQTVKIDKRLHISGWIKEYKKNNAQNNKHMISEKQIAMIELTQKQENNFGLYAYYVTPQRQTLSGYFNKQNHLMQDLLKNLNEPTLLVGPSQALKSQYCVIVKKFSFSQQAQDGIDYFFDQFLIVKKQISSSQLLNILRDKYEGLQKMQIQQISGKPKQKRQSYNFFIQDFKTGLIKLKQSNYFLPCQGPNKNHLLLVIAECVEKESNQAKQKSFQNWFLNQKDILTIYVKNQKTSEVQQLKGISGSLKTSQLRNIIFANVLDKNPQYESANNIVIKCKQKRNSKLFSEVVHDLPVNELVKYDLTILYSYSVLSVQSRLNQTEIIFYYRFKKFQFSEPLKIIVKKGQSQADVVKRLKNHSQILQNLKQEGFKNSILLLLSKDRFTINDVVDNQGKIIGKGDLQTVLKKQKNAVLTIQGFEKMVSQRLVNQGDQGEHISLLVHHISKTGQKIGNPVHLFLPKNIELMELKQKVMELIMNQSYEWENKMYTCNVFKLKMILYGKDSKKAIDIAQIQEQIKQRQVQKPVQEEGSNQLQQNKNDQILEKQQNQGKQKEESERIENIDEQTNTVTIFAAKQQLEKKEAEQQQRISEQKQKLPTTIFTFFAKTKLLKLSIVHNYLAKTIQPLKLNVE